MNELILNSGTYGLTKWIGQEEDIKIFTNHILLNKNDYTFIENSENLFNQDETVNVIDVEIKAGSKKVSRGDVAFAAFSGMVSASIDYVIVGKTDLSSLKLNEINKETLIKEMPKLLRLMKLSEDNVKEAEKLFDEKLNDFSKKVRNAENYKEMVMDFASGLTVKGLVFSIIENLLCYHIGYDTDGNIAIARFSEDEMIEGSFIKKILAGVILWIVDQANQYKDNGKFNEEKEDFIKLKNNFDIVKDLIKQLSNSKLYKDKEFDVSILKAELIKLINKSKEDEMKDILDQLAIQSVPVLFNRSLVKTYVIIKSFIGQIKAKNIISLEGLKYLDFDLYSEENKKALATMNTISTGVFAAMDATDAIVKAAVKAKMDAENAAVFAVEDDKVKAVTAILAGLKGGLCEFASRINVANMITLVTVTKIEWNYILEDLKKHPGRFKEADFINVETLLPKNLEHFTTLNKLETKILYSLEYRFIQYDIANTKDNNTQISKDKWCIKWMELSENATDINKLFETDEEKLYSMVGTYLGNSKENNWYRILLELSLFRPYFDIDLEENEKKQKSLKCSNEDYVLNILCKKQHFIEEKDLKGLIKNYKKHYDELGNNKINPVVGTVGAVAVTAATGGAAFMFAPAIATALVGSAFVGLHGAALTSASLALIGGGSLAAGGLGIAGGTAIIAGGGALIGLGTSGVTMAAMSLMTSSEYAKVDYAKLLTNCDYIMIGKYGKINDVKLIAQQIADTAEDYKTRYAVLEERLSDDKKTKKQNQAILKELSKSIDITDDSADSLIKVLNKAEKKLIN